MLLLAVGYASFTETLNISGTATGSATWEVVFTEDSTGGAEAIGNNGHTLTVNTTDLSYPGDKKEITAVIRNGSSMDIKLTGFKVTEPTADSDVTLEYISLEDDGTETLTANGGTCTYKFIVGWDENSTKTSINDTYSFEFTYQQDTETSTLVPSHDAHTTSTNP